MTALEEQVVTASIPLDFAGYWRGVLAMDFSVSEIKAFLVERHAGDKRGRVPTFMIANFEPAGFFRAGECPDLVVPARAGAAGTRAFVHMITREGCVC
ncbi:hypothetical protein LNQ52_20480 [Klebsiella pneumoniae subsp. pneumoniae]|nr:hypothetical protein [Klebsiella pneumoniae subsp. pneumoniae]